MNTVSTLCATSTIGAAAIGLAFGCIPNKTPHSAHPTANTADSRQHDRRAFSAPLQSGKRQNERPASSYGPLQSPSLRPDCGVGRPATSAGAQSFDKEDRGTSAASPALQNATEHEQSLSRPDSAANSNLVVRKRRSRLRSWTSFGQQDSAAKPDTNSHTKDEANQMGVLNTRPAKLTKRRTSKHDILSLQREDSTNASSRERRSTYTFGSLGSATSYSPSQPSSTGPSQVEAVDSRTLPYFQFLAASPDMRSPAGRGVHEAQGDVRRISPKIFYTPVLLKPEDMDAQPRRRLLRSRAEKRRSILSFDFSSYFGASSRVPEADSEPSLPLKRSRRSFSISDMLSGRPLTSSSTDELRVPGRRLQRPTGQRITSAPLLSGDLPNQSLTDASLASGKGYEAARSTSAMASYQGIASQSRDVFPIGATDYASHLRPLDTERAAAAPSEGMPSPNLSIPSVDPDGPIIARHPRYSATPSDFTSSQVGSDFDNRVFSSGEEDEVDFRSDTAYDSVRTGMTRGSAAFPGALFDKETGMEITHSRSTSLQDQSGAGSPTTMRAYDDIIFEEDENALTPKRPALPIRDYDGQNSPSFQNMKPHIESSSSQPRLPLSLGKLDWDSESDGWSERGDEQMQQPGVADSEDLTDWSGEPSGESEDHVATSAVQEKARPLHIYDHRRPRRSEPDKESKGSLFDWSEHPTLERGLSELPPRPKTVHGKKDIEGRNSRPNGRRAPSGPHARSQSVPAANTEQLEPRANSSSKFGTWGVGMKGATEDWDDDFDFDEPMPQPTVATAQDDTRADSGVAIIVPRAIREQQTSVLANIGLLKEWGILIEELKELRRRAASMGLESGHAREVFDEVDAMIDLADQEAEEPQFSADHISSAQWPDDQEDADRRSSIAPSIPGPALDDDVFGPLPVSLPTTAHHSPTRPRKNSEAIARSVIEAVQKRRDRVEPLGLQAQPKTNAKVPFDKGTLRHILPHLQGLVKSMKTILREAEGLGISPKREPRSFSDPPFSQAFIAPSDSPSRRCISPADGDSPIREALAEILSL